MPVKRNPAFFIIVIAFLFTSSVILLILFGSSFETAQTLLSNLSSDGEFETLTPSLYQQTRIPFLGLAVLIFIAALLFSIKPTWFYWATDHIKHWFSMFPSDCRKIWQTLISLFPESTLEWGLLIMVILMAVFSRGLLLNNSLSYDESYTYNAFVKPGLWTILTDYHVPNNHIFHSLLVWLSTTLFEISPLTLRLPAFIASVLSVMLVYFLGTSNSNRQTGLISSAAVSIWPWLVYYGKNARGYTLLILFSLLVFLTITYLKRHKNHLLWLLLPIFIALGGYTMPTMLYPTAAAYVWGLISIIAEDRSDEYSSKEKALIYLFLSAGSAIFLTAILYLPVLIWGTGYNSLANNHFLRTYPLQQLPAALIHLAKDTWNITFRRVELMRWPLIIGWALHLGLSFFKKKIKIPQSITTIIVMLLMLLIQRVVPYERTWLFLIPFLLIWGLSGWIDLIGVLVEKTSLSAKTASQGLTLLVIPILVFGIVRIFTEYRTDLQQIQNIPQAAVFLKGETQSPDCILTDVPEDMPYQFYHAYLDLDSTLLQCTEQTQRIFVIDSFYEGIYNQKGDVRRILMNNNIDPDTVDLDQIENVASFEEKGDFYSLGTTMILMVPVK